VFIIRVITAAMLLERADGGMCDVVIRTSGECQLTDAKGSRTHEV
jgi:hypothetical protein